jgi:alpha-2-macroglobulin
LDITAQSNLARLLIQLPEWKSQANSLAQEVNQNISQTGRTSVVNYPMGWNWLNSPTVAQAQALRLCVIGTSENCDRLWQGLLAMQRQGQWANTYDNAEALTAALEYSRTQAPAKVSAAKVSLNNQSIGKTNFQTENGASFIVNPLEGSSEIKLEKEGKGTLYYQTVLNYDLPPLSPGKIQGLRLIRSITELTATYPIQQHSLLWTQGIKVNSGQVFDIGIEIICDRPIENLVLTDPLPAGLEPIDSTFQTANPSQKAKSSDWQIAYQTIGNDRITAYSDSLEPGIYELHYLVQRG